VTARWEVERLGVGASEVSGLTGDSPWETEAGVWLRKVDLAPVKPDTDPMRIGRELEPTLVRLVESRLGLRLRHNAATFRHPEWPMVPLFATPDAFGPHRWAAVECKVVAHHLDDWRGGPPPYVVLQVQAQMAVVPKVQRVWVAALMGSELRTWPVDRDQAAITELEERVAWWWQTYVVSEVSPPASGPGDTWALLRARVSQQEGREDRLASDEEAVAAAHLAVLLDQRGDLDARLEEVRLELAGMAGEANLAGSGWRAVWSSRRTTDWAAVAQERRVPASVIDRHTRVSPVFTFRRTKAAEAAVEEAVT